MPIAMTTAALGIYTAGALIAVGMGIFAFGVARQANYLPLLLVGLAIMGMGMGCTMMPLSGAAVQALAPHQIARGSTLISVNLQVGGSIGTALMSMMLTNQFNRSESISAANRLARLKQDAARHGVAVDPSAIPQRTLDSDFAAGNTDVALSRDGHRCGR